MRTSNVIRFAVAAILVSMGCLALMFHQSIDGAGIYFAGLPAVLIGRSENMRPAPSREILILLLIVFGFVATALACDFILSRSASEAIQGVIRHPAFVVPLWLFMFWGLFRRWQQEKEKAAAQYRDRP